MYSHAINPDTPPRASLDPQIWGCWGTSANSLPSASQWADWSILSQTSLPRETAITSHSQNRTDKCGYLYTVISHTIWCPSLRLMKISQETLCFLGDLTISKILLHEYHYVTYRQKKRSQLTLYCHEGRTIYPTMETVLFTVYFKNDFFHWIHEWGWNSVHF